MFRNQSLNLTTDLEGSSEVGGLFLHPGGARAARACCSPAAAICSSATHRARFAERMLAELRGVMDEMRQLRRSGTRSAGASSA